MKGKKPKHLTSLSRLDSDIQKAYFKFRERFEAAPNQAIMDEIDRRVRKEHRLSPHMGTNFPRGNRNTYSHPCSYLHWKANKSNKSSTVRFCWSKHRNEAGYFLFWQETVQNAKGRIVISTTRWGARKGKRQAKEISHQRMLKWRERHVKTI